MRQLAGSTSIPAPIAGLNDRDALADMKPQYAVVLTNWWPYPSYVAVRKGYASHVTGFASTVETLAEYLPTSGNSKLFAAAGTSFYDVTSSGALGAAVQTGLSNARWETAQITTPGGSFIYFVNGVDSPRLWDGSAWTTVTGASSPAITGVTTSNLTNVCLFKNRLFFVEKNAMRVWYLPVNSIGGAANQLDLGAVFRMGGNIVACYPWTIDAGDGSDDHFVIITSNGEVAVYKGTDPSSSTAWALVGVFTLGKPLGKRCGVKYGGDLAINTTEGVFPLGKGLLSASVDRRVSLTDKIQNSTALAAASYGSNYGWQLCQYPDANMLILNVPAGNGANYQFAQNTITGAWTKFSGWNASCWLNASSGLYFGDGSAVKRAWTTNLDGTIGITADALPAFEYFGSKAQNKLFTMVKPYIVTSGSPSVLYGLNTDFVLSDPVGALSLNPTTGMVWGSMVWGSMTWGGGLVSSSTWQTVGAVANSAALRIKVLNNGAETRWINTDYVYQKGGIL